MKIIFALTICISILFSESFFYNNNKKVFLTPYYQDSYNITRDISSSEIKYYKQSNNKIIGIDNKILVRLNNDYSIDLLLKKYNINIVKIYSPTMYLVKIRQYDNVLEISNAIHEEKSVKYAQPNIYTTIKTR